MPALRLAHLLAFALFAASAMAQRPKTAAEALSRFHQVKDQAENDRRRAAGDLGDFADAEVTAVLVAEVARAKDIGYRQTVVRALGERLRPGDTAVPALQLVLREATNARLMEVAAEGLAEQGDPGVAALAAVLAEERSGGSRRSAVCRGLGRAPGDAARDVLVQETKAATGRDRLPPFEALEKFQSDPVLDPLRLLLARDGDPLVASLAVDQLALHVHPEAPAYAVTLARRLNDRSTQDQHAAVMRGLLVLPQAGNFELLLLAASRARDPFGKQSVDLWTKALGSEPLLRWLVAQAPVRKVAAECRTAAAALALVPIPSRTDGAGPLVRLLGHRDSEVARTAAMTLGGYGPDLALLPLQKMLLTGAEAVQPAAAEALHGLRSGDAAWLGDLVGHGKGKSAVLRTTAMQLLARSAGNIGSDGAAALQVAGENLDHKSWQVRAAAIDLIEALRLAPGIPWLIERFEPEQARLHEDVAGALFSLTKLRFPDAASWRAWWQKEGPTFRMTPLAKAGDRDNARNRGSGTVVTYWDIPVRSDRVAFVVDVSGSMNEQFGTGGGTRLDEAKRQLVRVLGMLPPKAKTNVIAFGNAAVPFRDSLQSLDAKLRTAAEAFAKDLAVRGATNVYAGLQRAFADPEVDTIFLLTDGQPSAGPIVAPDALAKEVAGWNLGRGLRIHTVALGGRSDFLERLARESGGEHTIAK